MDVRAQQAREHNQAAADLRREGRRRLSMRDRLIRQLREEDPVYWSYRRLAAEVGVSFKLIGIILGRQNGEDTSA